jgi:hypothetical protein
MRGNHADIVIYDEIQDFLEADGVSSTSLPESSVHGVSLTSWGNRYQAQVMRKGRRYYLGTFATEDEAVEAIALVDEALG